MRLNFDLFEKYPHYVFNFSGANRYRMMKEYYPADFAKIKKYVAAGRWFPAGSSMEENDVNSPSAESIIRQILYGKEYFRREFGKTSAEFMLPDCFGFPASLPSILAHAGIKGFSTQKLSAGWQPAPHVGGPDSPEKTPAGIPFNVGIWEGPDGKSVIAALNPGDYGGSVTYDLSKTPPAPATTRSTRKPSRGAAPERSTGRSASTSTASLTGVYADYMYYGTGDIGGSPTESLRQADGSDRHQEQDADPDCHRPAAAADAAAGDAAAAPAWPTGSAGGRRPGEGHLRHRRPDVPRHQRRTRPPSCRATRATSN